MTASELIERLQHLIDKEGDLEVRHATGLMDGAICGVNAYDEEGFSPRDNESCVPTQIYLH